MEPVAAAPAAESVEWPERLPSDRKARGGVVWDVILIIATVILAIEVLFLITGFIIDLVVDLPPVNVGTLTDQEVLRVQVALWLQNAHNAFLFGLVPFAWVLGTRHEAMRGALDYLRLHWDGRAVLLGSLLGVGLVAVVLGAMLLLQAAFPDIPADPNQDAFVQVLNVPLIIGVSLVAGVCEEIFFRGVLQKKVGMWLQADIFALFHISNGPIGVVVTLSIGLLFGWLVRRGHSLWLVIAAHFVYDLVLLSLATGLEAGSL